MKIYTFKFYLNAKHYILIENKSSNIHPHTWEITVEIVGIGTELIKFTDIENIIRTFLMIYEGKLLNNIPPFNYQQPTLENIIDVFYIQIKNIIENNGWKLYKLTVSESPARAITICEQIPESNNNILNKEKRNKKLITFDKNKNMNTEKQGKESLNYNIKGLNTFANTVYAIPKDGYFENIIDKDESIISKETKNTAEKQRKIGFIWDTQETNIKAYLHYRKSNKFYKRLDKTNSKNNGNTFINSLNSVNENYLEIEHSHKKDDVEIVGYNTLDEDNKYYKMRQKYLEEIAFMKEKDKEFRNKIISNTFYLVASTILGILLVLYINRKGIFPWGSDTWGHLYKAKFLYESILKRDFYPILTFDWYNGIEPFRYWAPFPYYLLATFIFSAHGNVFIAYNLFILFVFIAGCLAWLLIGNIYNINKYLLLAISILWFVLPDNLRVLFSEGNIPRVVVSVLFLYLIYFILCYMRENTFKYGLFIIFLVLLIVLCHAMIAAMVMITVSLLILVNLIISKNWRILKVILYAIIGVLLSSIWLLPALKGGLISIDQDAMQEVVSQLTYNISVSLNPFLRLKNIEVYYFGLSVLLISLFGLLFGKKQVKSYFLIVLIIFLGTTKALLSIIIKIPMNQLFWMMRFTPLALTIFLVGIISWKDLKNGIKLLFLALLFFDSLISAKVLMYNVPYNGKFAEIADVALEHSDSKIAVLDLSEFGSFFSYYLTYNAYHRGEQLYGWAWQGAKTAFNITQINTGIEKEWYEVSIDRCKELGADILIVKRDIIKDYNRFNQVATSLGFKSIFKNQLAVIYKLNGINEKFATKTDYPGLAIGKYSSIISYIFPNFEVGFSNNLDNYELEDLLQYKTIFLSGFETKSKERSESLVKQLTTKGVRVVVDLSGFEAELLSSRPEFLSVIAQPVQFIDNFGEVLLKDAILRLNDFPQGYSEWNTIYYQNLKNIYGSINFKNEYLPWLGEKDGIIFLGANILFYAYLTHDNKIISELEKIIGFKSLQIPKREIVKYDVIRNGRKLIIKAQKKGVIIPIAALDIIEGEYLQRHNLLLITKKIVTLNIRYSFLSIGLSVTILTFIILIVAILIKAYRKRLYFTKI